MLASVTFGPRIAATCFDAFFDNREGLGAKAQALIDNHHGIDAPPIPRTNDIDQYSDAFCYLPGADLPAAHGRFAEAEE